MSQKFTYLATKLSLITTAAFALSSCDDKQAPETTDAPKETPSDSSSDSPSSPKSTDPAPRPSPAPEPKITHSEPEVAPTTPEPESDSIEKIVADSLAIIKRATAAAKAKEDEKVDAIMEELEPMQARIDKLGIDIDKEGSIPEPLAQKLDAAMAELTKVLAPQQAGSPAQPTVGKEDAAKAAETIIKEMIKHWEDGAVILTALADGKDTEANTEKFKTWKKDYQAIQGRMYPYEKELDDDTSELSKKLKPIYGPKVTKALGEYGQASLKALNSPSTPEEAKTLISKP